MSTSDIPRHRVFLSYHDGRHSNPPGDHLARQRFERTFGERLEVFASDSVQEGDIDTTESTERIRQIIRDVHLANASVTIVLIGARTWQRKHVDWEIHATLRDTQGNPRGGLMGILVEGTPEDPPFTVPLRLQDNVTTGYATVHPWPRSHQELAAWIDDAYRRKTTHQPNSGRELMGRNWSDASARV